MGPMYQLTIGDNCHVTINQVHYTALLHCNSLNDNNMHFTVIYCPGGVVSGHGDDRGRGGAGRGAEGPHSQVDEGCDGFFV